MGWDSRFAWSGEIPLTYPGLDPVALQRFSTNDGAEFPDAVDPSHIWTVEDWATSSDGWFEGRWGRNLGMNRGDPAAQQRKMTLPYFEGLWPEAGRLLIGLWVSQNYTMQYNPLLSTRGGSSPLAYLSTYADGDVRQQVYSASGALLHNSYASMPWGVEFGWLWLGQYLDLDARTTQLVAVRRDTGESWVGAPQSFSGTPNLSSTADLDVFSLYPTASYWSGGYVDEVLVAHPTAEFDIADFVDALARGTTARGADYSLNGALLVTDAGVTAAQAATLQLGSEPVSWDRAPEPSIAGAIPYRSTDDGATWLSGPLPDGFTGLLRWDVPLEAGEVFAGLDLIPPAPTLAPIADQALVQQTVLRIPLEATYSGPVTWTAAAAGITVEVEGSELVVASGWASGDITVTVTVIDSRNRRASRSFTVTITPTPWTAPPPPSFPRAPIVVWDADGPDVAIIDALTAKVTKEVNGEHLLEFSLPLGHPRSPAIRNERVVELSGEPYRIRRVTTTRQNRVPALSVYCEATYYDLAYAGQIAAREYVQAPAGQVLEEALEGTGWSIGAVTVTTLRTYNVEETTPLGLLRKVQEQHGGDLVFDGVARTVSLVEQSGQDNGVAFFYGRGLSSSKRVVDTTSLVTRIHARNAEGVTIASVNGGVGFLEDFTWTDEVREATYDFASGTSPFTMLSMTRATLAARSKPAYSYEFTVADLSHQSGQLLDAFDVADLVTVIDDELDIRVTQRVLKVEHDVMRPWSSKITLSGKLRELGSRPATEAGALTTGVGTSSFDLVPFNSLRNGRFDNHLAHWASSGVAIVDGQGSGDNAARFEGPGVRWIEQTVSPDNRDVYSLSLRVDTSQAGYVPNLRAIATVQYEDGSTEVVPIDLV